MIDPGSLKKLDDRIDAIVGNSDFASSAARMAEARGLAGVEAVRYAAGLVDAARRRVRDEYLEEWQKGERAERERIASILGSPAAQGQMDRARELAFKTRTPADQAIAQLRDGCTETAGDDASALASAILNSDAPDGGAR